MRNAFVLVHGSWHGAWCWDFVAPLLRAAGCAVAVPDLTAEPAVPGARITLATHIEDVIRALPAGEAAPGRERTILVGHSYAGMVITGVAARVPARIAMLVYLDAYLPTDGQSLLDLWAPEERAAALKEIEHGAGLRPAPTPARLGVDDPQRAAWLAARLRPHPLTTYAEPVVAPAAVLAGIPCAYIHCTRGATVARFGPFAAKARARGWPVLEIGAGHDVMIAEPQATASALLALAARGLQA